VASAFGICLSQTAGTMQFLHDGAWTKLFQVGYAAMNGLIAATLAAAGFKGAGQAIEGKAGFLHAYAPQPQPERAVADLGEVFETLNIAVKPYPSCRYSHAALDAVIALRAEHAIASEEVEGVEIGLPRTGWHLIGDPLAAKQRPQNIVDGQFSMPFLAAVALRTGRLGWDDYPIYLKDRHVLSLCQRITAIIDPQAEAEFPANMSAVVRIRTPRGRFERFVKAPKGEPDNFITLDELRAKFASLVGPYLGAAREHRLAVALLTLEQASSLRELMVLTRPQESTGRHAAAAGD
jgi:2-methylcitrate dehydratase PrpD